MLKKTQKKSVEKPRMDLLDGVEKEKIIAWRGRVETGVKSWFSSFHSWEDSAFMDDVRQATLRGAHPASNFLFWAMILFICVMIFWASVAELDEVTRGEGQVIPSGKVQVVQNLEGGIVEEIFVRQGDFVDKGQALLRLDNTGFVSSYSEKKTRAWNLQADIARLKAEINGTELVFADDIQKEAPMVIAQARKMFHSRRAELDSGMNILRKQADQRKQELQEALKRRQQMRESYRLSSEELKLTKPLEEKGVVSKVEVLRLERQVNDTKGDMNTAELAVPSAEAALAEAQSRLNEARLRQVNEARKEMAEKEEEFNRLVDVLKADVDRVERTLVKSPVRAEVKQVLVNTVGGVVQPGMDLVELIPLDDTLLVEAKVRPQDIAFIRPGQEAVVKITAYDFSIYGGLTASLERISPDTITDENGDAFYKILVRTEKNYLGSMEHPLPIMSGMVASVDILTGKKTVLDYVLKPLRKARERALRER